MIPDKVGYLTELDSDFAKALQSVKDYKTFQAFLDQWQYWLDDESKNLKGSDWDKLYPLIEDCRKPNVIPEDKHNEAMALMMPRKLMEISIRAHQFGVPWGCMYLRLKEMKIIDF